MTDVHHLALSAAPRLQLDSRIPRSGPTAVNTGVCMACHGLQNSYHLISSLPKSAEVVRQVEQDLAVVVSEREAAWHCQDSEGSTSMRPLHRGMRPTAGGAKTHLVRHKTDSR